MFSKTISFKVDIQEVLGLSGDQALDIIESLKILRILNFSDALYHLNPGVRRPMNALYALENREEYKATVDAFAKFYTKYSQKLKHRPDAVKYLSRLAHTVNGQGAYIAGKNYLPQYFPKKILAASGYTT